MLVFLQPLMLYLFETLDSDLIADIKTYAVTPLNEECGLIEWVDNLKTLREIIVRLLKERGIGPNVCHFLSSYHR